jgi:hypothetical protein
VWDAATGAPLRATARVGAPGLIAFADSTGHFSLDELASGVIVVHARALGYAPQSVTVRIVPRGVARVSIALHALPRALDTVQVLERDTDRAGFDAVPLPSLVSMRGSELARVPALGGGDAFRAAATLPGVAARNDFSAGFNVRGGEADQNLVLLDGIPIYNPFHLGGLFGTFIDPAVSRIDILTGAFPSLYGGRLSSVLDVTSTAETRPGVHATGDLSLLSSSALVGGTVGGGRVSWNVAGRRTYADQVVALARPGREFPYHFRDAQLHLRASLPRGGLLSATAYSGRDIFDYDPERADRSLIDGGSSPLRLAWGNTVAGVTYIQPIDARTIATQRISITHFATAFDAPDDTLALSQSVEEVNVAGSVQHIRGDHTFGAGYELARHRTAYRERLSFGAGDDVTLTDPFVTDGDTLMRQSSGVAALFLDDAWTPHARVSVRAGVRIERVPSARWIGVSPRVSARLSLSPAFALSAAVGRHAQWMRAMRNEDLPLRIYDVWVASDSQVPVSTATHAVLGAEHWFSDSRFIRVEGYGKRFDRLSEPASSIDPRVRPSLLRYFGGAAYGVELYARQLERDGFSGWLSYSYGVATREREGRRYFPAYDRRHQGNIVVGYSAGAYTLGGHLAVATGTPYTGWSGVMTRWRYDPATRRWTPEPDAGDANVVRGPRNAERYPPYVRLDVGIERRFSVGSATIHGYLNVINVFNRRSVLAYTLDPARDPPTLGGVSQFPLLPSAGMRVRF